MLTGNHRLAVEDSVSRIRKQDAGFTLMELMIVMAIIGILMLVAVPRFSSAIKMAKESVLKEDLHVMRAAIDSYTMDKQKAPQTLEDLITDGYLKAIPVDPFTQSKDTWVTDSNGALYSVDQTEPGIDDVHSGSQELSTAGQAYSTW
jgi:general secretion pathway protein G